MSAATQIKEKIKSIEAFLTKHFDENCSDDSKIEAKIFNSFLKRMTETGYTVLSASDGEERHVIAENNRFDTLDVIFSVDESSITMKAPNGEKFALYIVLGNGDATSIYDHSDISEEVEKTVFQTWAESVKTHSAELYEMNWA